MLDQATLCHQATHFLGSLVRPLDWLAGGYEADVLHVASERAHFVLHVSPLWRTAAQLAWTQSVALQAATSGAPVVVPIVRAGRSFFSAENRLVSVYPYIDGTILDRENAQQRKDAARCLGRIHAALGEWRPAPPPFRPQNYPIPDYLTDTALDAAWAALSSSGLLTGATHGDFYRGNLLVRDNQIVGVIDWNDATVRPILLEVAGAAFELCKSEPHHLHPDRVAAFIQTYLAAGGTLPPRERRHLLTAIRLWVRNDILPTLFADPAKKADEYVAQQIAAFHHLKTITLPH